MAKGKRFVNPTDKARKEARKKELKKNKKQRQLVRSTVIEKKDPTQIITDLEKLDQLEYDALQGSAISDSLYKDKRKKLKETWERVLKHYLKEDPDKHKELKKLESDYEISHNKKLRQYEAIKAAQEVKLEDIPLPPDPDGEHESDVDPNDQTPLPDCITYPPAGAEYASRLGIPPGCPPGVPPNLREVVAKLNQQIPSRLAARIPTLPVPPTLLAPTSGGLLPTPATGHHSHTYSYNRSSRQMPDRSSQNNDQRPARLAPPPTDQQPSSIEEPASHKAQKAAVIESKPVIFRPKVTKFVPSALRKKQSAGIG